MASALRQPTIVQQLYNIYTPKYITGYLSGEGAAAVSGGAQRFNSGVSLNQETKPNSHSAFQH